MCFRQLKMQALVTKAESILKGLRLSVLLVLWCPTVVASALTTPDAERLFSAAGSNTIGAQLMKNLLLGYLESEGVENLEVLPLERANEYRVQGTLDSRQVYVDVAAHGSSTGFRGLQDGTADIAMASRRITAQEVQRLSSLGNLQDYDSEHVIAIDGLAIIVHRQNPLDVISLTELGQIFSGQISNWSQLNGPDAPIELYARDENSGTWDTFRSLVLKDKKLSASARRFESNDTLSDLVANDPHGIGFVGLGSLRQSKVLAVKDEGTAALLPVALTVATEDYMLARRLFLYSPKARQTATIKKFLAYVQSDAGQDIVRRSGFVSQNLITVRYDAPVEGSRQYRELVQEAERLSVNLRFAEDSAELDNKARRDMLRIADYMRRAENQNKRLVLVGFGDEIQNRQRAYVLSRLRATAVKSALFRLGIPSEPVIGLGADVPVASNAQEGRIKNRRVEIWVKNP